MKPYLALIKVDLKLAFRDKAVIFFNYLFPLIFFFIFAGLLKAERGGTISFVLSMVLVMGILGNGLFGAGVRAVQERELNILRRFKVTPISPTPILVASLTSGWVIYMPIVILLVCLSHFIYGMPFPGRIYSLFCLITLGVFAFRAIGLILASVANSMQGSQILIQLLYMPMLFLSGATFPVTMLPQWAQVVSQFLPTSYLVTGFQGIFFRNESFFANGSAVLALIGTALLGTFISVKLFRWEKDEKISRAAMGWVLAVLAPFLILGSYQTYSRDHLRKAQILQRDLERSGTLLFQGPRIFIGNGQVIETGAVLVKDGIIAEVFDAPVLDPIPYKALVIEGSGKTLLPGLIDVHVHLAATAGLSEFSQGFDIQKAMSRALAAYLYCGVTTVKSVADPLDESLKLRGKVNEGERLGSSFMTCGPAFTIDGGHGTEFFESFPATLKAVALQQWVRLPKTGDEARQQVRELKASGVDGIKGILESGTTAHPLNRMDVSILEAIAQEARIQNLPLVIHTGNSKDVADALKTGPAAIEHGSFQDVVAEELFREMAKRGVNYDPTLSVAEALSKAPAEAEELLDRSLVQQVVPAKLLISTRNALRSGEMKTFLTSLPALGPGGLALGKENLLRAFRAGVPLVTGTDSGHFLLFHGPAIHRELQLWVECGIPPAVALKAATFSAAHLLRADQHIGLIAKGYDADLLLVDGNPLQDIGATERISLVIHKGERINRSKLFEQE